MMSTLPAKKSRIRPFRSRNRNRHRFESLERRDLLAGDFAAGDANFDHYIDESDFVLAMKAGKYETGEAAEWAEGDWNGDGLFTSADRMLVRDSGLYRQGAYDDAAGNPENSLGPIAATEQGDVMLLYDSATGDLRFIRERRTRS